jgi:GNAT superfamily N-acetyltransferase
MEIRPVTDEKKKYLPLLLLADEQENMIDRYLDKGDMFALFDGDLRAVCVVIDRGDSTCELKNIAVVPVYQRMGYGKYLIAFLCRLYSGPFHTMYVGTGDSPITLPFYLNCGFSFSHRVKNFFIDNYDHPIYECGSQLIDMIYLKKSLKCNEVQR